MQPLLNTYLRILDCLLVLKRRVYITQCSSKTLRRSYRGCWSAQVGRGLFFTLYCIHCTDYLAGWLAGYLTYCFSPPLHSFYSPSPASTSIILIYNTNFSTLSPTTTVSARDTMRHKLFTRRASQLVSVLVKMDTHIGVELEEQVRHHVLRIAFHRHLSHIPFYPILCSVLFHTFLSYILSTLLKNFIQLICWHFHKN